jgi:hypothetical protein
VADNNQLLIPQAAEKDPKSLEVLRVWLAGEQQHVSIRVGVWDDPAGWGLLLADLAKHVANSYQQAKGLERSRVLQRIKAALDVELGSPTDDPSGSVLR